VLVVGYVILFGCFIVVKFLDDLDFGLFFMVMDVCGVLVLVVCVVW